MRNTRVYPSFLGSTSSRATNARTVAVTGCSVARVSAVHRVGQAMALACIVNLLASLRSIAEPVCARYWLGPYACYFTLLQLFVTSAGGAYQLSLRRIMRQLLQR